MAQCNNSLLTRRRFMAVGGVGLATSMRPVWSHEPDSMKRIVFIAGTSSHDFGGHQHAAGCRFLANCLNALPHVKTEVVADQWPSDERIFDGVDAVIIYGDGGGSHIVNGHEETVAQLIRRGVGLGILHYALMPPTEQMYSLFLQGIGGYYEPGWSVNPTWHAEIKHLPVHPITRGVKPFAIKDEWYYHMRFVPEFKGVQPLLSVVPPASTLKRPDGPHSNNPAVRKEVLELGRAQHLAWAYERPDRGRGFGFTGAHTYWNWAHSDIRTLVLNAIAWLAHMDIPEKGIPSSPPSAKSLAEFVGPAPTGFEFEPVQRMIDRWNTGNRP